MVLNLPLFRILHHPLKVRTVEVGSGVAVIAVMVIHKKAVGVAIIRQNLSLRFDGDAGAVLIVIVAEPFVDCRYGSALLCFLHLLLLSEQSDWVLSILYHICSQMSTEILCTKESFS